MRHQVQKYYRLRHKAWSQRAAGQIDNALYYEEQAADLAGCDWGSICPRHIEDADRLASDPDTTDLDWPASSNASIRLE